MVKLRVVSYVLGISMLLCRLACANYLLSAIIECNIVPRICIWFESNRPYGWRKHIEVILVVCAACLRKCRQQIKLTFSMMYITIAL